MANFKEIINYFEVFSDKHTQNNGFGYGNIAELNTNELEFPGIFVNPVSSSTEDNVTTYKYDVYFLDVLLQDKSNLLDVMNNTTQIGNDFILFFTDNSEATGFELDELNVSITPFVGSFDELLGGWVYSFDIETVMSLGCNLPIEWVKPEEPDQPNAVYGSGTTNYLTKWNGVNSITDSLINEEGDTININGDLYIIGNIIDSASASGTPGQLLSRDNDGILWVEAPETTSYYENDTPVPEEIGGVEVGSTFPIGTTVQDVLTDILYPFQTPYFSSFSISTLGGSHDIGKVVTGGSLTANWGSVNPTNIEDDSIEIYGSSLTTVSGLENNGTTQVTLSPFTATSTKSWVIKGKDTHGDYFTKTLGMYFYNRRYWGSVTLSLSDFSALTDLERDTIILNLTGASVGSGSELATSRVKTYNGINGAGEYLIFAFPTSFGTPSFTVNGLPNSAFTKMEYAFTNNEGYVNTYQVWFSNTTQAGALALFAIK